mgnify:CR=1 FL=1
MSASDTLLKELHAELARQLLDVVKNGVPVFDKEGDEVGTRKATAAELEVAVTFPKTTDITAGRAGREQARPQADGKQGDREEGHREEGERGESHGEEGSRREASGEEGARIDCRESEERAGEGGEEDAQR